MTGVPETTNVSSRGKPPFPSTIIPAPLIPYQNYFTALFWLFVFFSWRVILHHSQTSSTFVLFCSFFFFLSWFVCICSFFFLLLLLLRLWMFGCVRVCVFVFSLAASVDYGSFADRCSTWLELLRLKAHTIRRGSVKTSRRTQSLAHSGDNTHKYRTRLYKQSRTHALSQPSMHAAGGRSIIRLAPAF